VTTGHVGDRRCDRGDRVREGVNKGVQGWPSGLAHVELCFRAFTVEAPSIRHSAG
jgi:hypothetical protein